MSGESTTCNTMHEITNDQTSAVSQPEAISEAMTADKERLFSIIQDHRREVLLAALRNPRLEAQHLLTLLKRREMEALITAIYSSKRLIEAYAVKFALAAHLDTPAHIAQALLPFLYPFDLLKLCLKTGISPDIRLAAERKIIQLIPTQPLGNKLTLARRGTATILEALLREGSMKTFEVILDNPHLKEGSLYQFLASSRATADVVAIVARNARWKGRPNIRQAILKNPQTPPALYTAFLAGLPSAALLDLQASPRLTTTQKELVRRFRSGGHS